MPSWGPGDKWQGHLWGLGRSETAQHIHALQTCPESSVYIILYVYIYIYTNVHIMSFKCSVIQDTIFFAWALPHPLLRSADQWHDADRRRRSSCRLQWHGPMVRSEKGGMMVMAQGQEIVGSIVIHSPSFLYNLKYLKWRSGEFSGDGNPVGCPEFPRYLARCHCDKSSDTVTSKEQWISSFASFSRWRPWEIMHFGTSAGDWACDRGTHTVRSGVSGHVASSRVQYFVGGGCTN